MVEKINVEFLIYSCKRSEWQSDTIGCASSSLECILLLHLLQQQHISAKSFLLLIHLHRLNHMIFRSTGYVGIADDVSVNVSPHFLLVDNLLFTPVIHPHFIEPGTGISDKHEFI